MLKLYSVSDPSLPFLFYTNFNPQYEYVAASIFVMGNEPWFNGWVFNIDSALANYENL